MPIAIEILTYHEDAPWRRNTALCAGPLMSQARDAGAQLRRARLPCEQRGGHHSLRSVPRTATAAEEATGGSWLQSDEGDTRADGVAES